MIDYTSSEFELRWPPALFAEEADRVLGEPHSHATELLIFDAFANGSEIIAGHGNDADRALQALRAHIGELRNAQGRKPYWRERKSPDSPELALTLDAAMKRFVQIIEELTERGYFNRAFPVPCVDDHDTQAIDPSLELQIRVGEPDLWPLRRSLARWDHQWELDLFLTLIEVFDDLVARPVDAYQYHPWDSCGWHYSQYSARSGKAVYRAAIDALLDHTDIALRLARDGEDEGRLVTVADPERASLIHAAASRTHEDAATVRHAIALFRGRHAGREEKRSAVVALAGVLEHRRRAIKQELLTRDEGALFEIANTFDLRHRTSIQKSDYADHFLDWVFWWYLATVELMDQLATRTT